MDNLNEYSYSIAFSASAALLTRCITHPLDTLKTILQADASSSLIPRRHRPSLLQTASSIVKTEGIRGFYRGISVSVAFSVPAMSIYLTSYDVIKATLGHRLPGGEESAVVHGASACVAEGLSGLLWTPMEVLKNRLQTTSLQGPDRGLSDLQKTANLAASVYRAEGLRGFYRGYLLSLGVFVPYTVTFFLTYEQLKMMAIARTPSKSLQELPFYTYLLSSACAGAVAGAISNALDVVKTRVQINSTSSSQRTASALEVMRHMWVNDGGLRAFTKGMVARVVWVVPSVAISMTFYESLKSWRKQSLHTKHLHALE
ncbi:mitochondrial carrier domain-containing protein [Cladochytrium replicatum]|nr:mitochondrial carrier domain-containing protein [Cladochytrium replicatum]